ncbi:MAG: flavin reductase [Lentimicrobiaceae bacterium]|jgi:flavin reductase (DIM6/NTAB) family NADH-FMN oxidoreductase RutF|nr:flavin reductase [Lentimicrobiaceae bacterium]
MKTTQNQENKAMENTWESKYDKLTAFELPDNVMQLIGKEWMLITAGDSMSFNTMTASWGSLGYLWNRPAAFIFVRDTRYTYQFLQEEAGFTLSFFEEKYRKALGICGSKSGRDTDKVAEAGLTPLETPSGLMTFSEARMIIECEKMFVQKMNLDNFVASYQSKIIAEAYESDPATHDMFVAEIKAVWVKK